MKPFPYIALFLVVSVAPGCLVGSQLQTSVVDVMVEPPGPLTTTKSGGSVTFSLWLQGVALGAAIVELESSNAALGMPTPQTLFFRQDAWGVPQKISIIGEDDGIAGDENYVMGFNLRGTSFLLDYTQRAELPLTLIAHDDVAAILAAQVPTSKGTTLQVTLRTQPADDADVTLTLTSAAAQSFSPQQLTFTAANFAVPQPVDVAYDPTIVPLVTFDAVSADPRYNGLSTEVAVRSLH